MSALRLRGILRIPDWFLRVAVGDQPSKISGADVGGPGWIQGCQVVERRAIAKMVSIASGLRTSGRLRSQRATWARGTTNTSSGAFLTATSAALTGTTTPATSTGNPQEALSNLAARFASWRLLWMYGCRCPLTMNVSPPTQILAPGWCLALIVNTPPGPITTWSMSEPRSPTGTA